VNDLRLSLRSLLRTPAFTAVVVIVLALGIGANTAIFSVIDAAMLKPIPVPDADRVVRLSASHPQSFVWFNPNGFEVWPSFRQSRVFNSVGAYVTGERNLQGSTGGRLRAAAVTPEFFEVMNVAPVLGRVFTSDDFRQSFHVAVISYQLWQTHFRGAKDVLGSQIVLGREAFAVMAVMPQRFELPDASQVWLPARWGSEVVNGGWVFPIVLARMARGVTARDASRELLRLDRPMGGRRYTDAAGVTVSSLRNTLVGSVRPIILLIAAAAFVVLLVASTNIASLLLTRASARGREFAVRRALGASNRDIARQIFTEGLLLAGMAGIAMLPVAMWTLDAVRAWVPVRMYGAANIALDSRALLAAAIFALLTAVLFSAIPLWSVRRGASLDALRGAALATADPRWRRFRSSLAIAEVAFALVLLAAAVTVIRTVSQLMAVDLGVRAERVLVVGLDWPDDAAQPERKRQLLHDYELAFRALPGVESAAVTTTVPGDDRLFRNAELLIDDAPVPPKAGYVGRHTSASPEYFSLMGVELVAGRLFASGDHFFAPKVAIISESFARRFQLRPDQVVGRKAVLDHREVQIVGVVRDVRHDGPAGDVDATAYVPFEQRLSSGPMQIVVKARTDPSQLIAAVRAAGSRVDPNVPLYNIRPFEEIREMHVRDRRFVMTMLSWFGALAFVLAVLGLYAVVSYLVHLRTREIGIRIAMGATTEEVRLRVLANGMAHCLAGVLIGCALAFGLSRAMSGQIRYLGELDTLTLMLVSAAFLGTAGMAAWLPARRATLIDPVQALRFE
jgi:putative ABC transport system permease protein